MEHNDVSSRGICELLQPTGSRLSQEVGAQTEHCEQDIADDVLRGNSTGLPTDSLQVAGGPSRPTRKTRFLLKAVRRGRREDGIEERSTRLVVGPAGAGEHLRQQPTPLLDGLVHGERRWFTMQPDIFMKLRSKAEPGAPSRPGSCF